MPPAMVKLGEERKPKIVTVSALVPGKVRGLLSGADGVFSGCGPRAKVKVIVFCVRGCCELAGWPLGTSTEPGQIGLRQIRKRVPRSQTCIHWIRADHRWN